LERSQARNPKEKKKKKKVKDKDRDVDKGKKGGKDLVIPEDPAVLALEEGRQAHVGQKEVGEPELPASAEHHE
jgi:hypothetical protein